MTIKQIPRKFYADHVARGLAAPPSIRETKRHVWVEVEHPAMAEIVDDAEFYAAMTTGGRDKDIAPFVRAARALLEALK